MPAGYSPILKEDLYRDSDSPLICVKKTKKKHNVIAYWTIFCKNDQILCCNFTTGALTHSWGCCVSSVKCEHVFVKTRLVGADLWKYAVAPYSRLGTWSHCSPSWTKQVLADNYPNTEDMLRRIPYEFCVWSLKTWIANSPVSLWSGLLVLRHGENLARSLGWDGKRIGPNINVHKIADANDVGHSRFENTAHVHRVSTGTHALLNKWRAQSFQLVIGTFKIECRTC